MAKVIHINASMKPGSNLGFRIRARIRSLFYRRQKDVKKTPIVINNFNRLSYLKQQIAWLKSVGLTNIYIIDNSSSYPPLLEYYKTLPYRIFQLNKNVGHLSIWKTIIFKWFENDYYVYTDPDIIPDGNCPPDFMSYFKLLLDRYPDFGKVGFALKTDDLPDHYDKKDKVIDWEEQYWKDPVEPGIFPAKIDTTFALYRPGAKGGWWLPALRVAGDYCARHLPWYADSTRPDEEEQYFISNAHGSSSWYKRTEVYGES